jgi:alkanesulfonate monooxygenase SsuD/methylene tetrahydromethanopterin reductase-like flavin-dependent oxidoreductase (luciferase family)
VDAFTPLAATAAWDPRLRLDSAIVPVHTRGPAVLAQTAWTLADLADGGLVLGIGSSVPAHVTDLNGIPFDEPLRRTRDTLRFLTRALRGEEVSGAFDTFAIHGFALPAPPARPSRSSSARCGRGCCVSGSPKGTALSPTSCPPGT